MSRMSSQLIMNQVHIKIVRGYLYLDRDKQQNSKTWPLNLFSQPGTAGFLHVAEVHTNHINLQKCIKHFLISAHGRGAHMSHKSAKVALNISGFPYMVEVYTCRINLQKLH